ncbi:HK97 family phage prohead protease [Amycolatopsis minnesotensis]|uniref:Prohead serine protease domain-containing protein n=1 Tax=Amycolatopsis minnesotensis TaxID=337894 RepID=A0ABP5CFJ9_9PSEU
MKRKTCPVRIKAAGEQDGTEDGVFEAIVAAYNVDSVGDKILPGAFADTLDEWKSSGNPIPVLWSHMSHDPEYHIGYVEDAEEREEGLWVRARIDLDEPKAGKVYRLLKGRRVRQFSFAYDVQEGGWIEEKDGDGEGEGYYELRKLKLYEVGPTLIGANQDTELLTVKTPADADPPPRTEPAAPSAKAGRTLSAKNETALRDALGKIAEGTEAIETVLSSLDSGDEDKSVGPAGDPPAPPTGESPSKAASSALLRATLALLEAESQPLTA